eukprot:jgi/Galph1/2956/GphlegSOOS_G1596.1
MVREVANLSAFDRVLKEAEGKLVVIDFFAQWCGPCHFISPFIDSLSTKYPRVVFAKVDVDQARDVASTCGISAMPTFHLYRNSSKVDELVGADPNALEALIKKHMDSMPSSGGYVLGHGGDSNNVINWDAGKSTEAAEKEASSKDGLYNESYLKQLEEMGFPKLRAKRALLRTKQESVDTAMNWLFEHMEDEDIDQPLEEEEKQAREQLENNSQLSSEEKRARSLEALERVRKKRQEEEKKAEIEREKTRIKSGKELAEAKARIEEQKRKAEVERLQKDKLEARKERERLRELLRQDREERLARTGKVPEVATTAEKKDKESVRPTNVQPHQGPGIVQLRFPDGSKLEREFEPTAKLRQVAQFVSQQRPDINRFSLAQTYPRKVFTEAELDSLSLEDAQLVPRGLLLVNQR